MKLKKAITIILMILITFVLNANVIKSSVDSINNKISTTKNRLNINKVTKNEIIELYDLCYNLNNRKINYKLIILINIISIILTIFLTKKYISKKRE